MRTRTGGAKITSPGINHGLEGLRQGNRDRDVLNYTNGTPTATARVTRSAAITADSASPPVRTSPRSHRKRPAPVTPTAADAAIRRSKRTRSSRQSGFYNVDTSDDEADDSLAPPNHEPRSLLVHVEQSPTPRSRSTYKAPKRNNPPVRLTLGTSHLLSPRKAATVASPNHGTTPNSSTVASSFIPDWLRIEEGIWQDIFEYASLMLQTERPSRAQWLLSASTICRELSIPALKALYHSPPLASRVMADGLAMLLSKDQSTTRHNYRPKVKELQINVYSIAAKAHKGELLDYHALVGGLSELRYIGFYHWKDEPHFRAMNDNLRWNYPQDLFDAIQEANSRLVRWTWNRRFMGSDMGFSFVKKIHQTKQFSHLKRLDLLNYQLPSILVPPSRTADPAEVTHRNVEFIRSVTDAISVLPYLEHLSVGYSSIVDSEFLSLLPALKSLTLFKCWEVEDVGFTSYLKENGHRLEHLSLQHNPALTLSFMTILGNACPNLKTLSMDFKVFAQHEYGYHDTDPVYDWILTPDQIPDWPSTLETLELKNMKKWSSEAAEVFFRSLVDSAPNLLSLREIDMKIMLDIPIRQRSEFRDKWVPKLEKVFLRETKEPVLFYSLRSVPFNSNDVVLKCSPSKIKRVKKRKSWAETESPVRMSSRIANFQEQLAQATATSSSSSSRASSVVRDLRTGLNRPSYVEPDTDDEALNPDADDAGAEEDEEDKLDSEPSPDNEPFFCHGMCKKVEILIDNQKPAAQMYQMADFLDHEEGETSGEDASDEDWNGADREEDDDVYAW